MRAYRDGYYEMIPTQKIVYQFITENQPCTCAQIVRGTGLIRGNVNHSNTVLIEQGYLKFDKETKLYFLPKSKGLKLEKDTVLTKVKNFIKKRKLVNSRDLKARFRCHRHYTSQLQKSGTVKMINHGVYRWVE